MVQTTYADILAPAVNDILNCSFHNSKVSQIWKIADVSPIPKTSNITDLNKDMRPISLTSTLSKIAEQFVIDLELKPKIDPINFDLFQIHVQLMQLFQCCITGWPRQMEQVLE